MSAREYNVLLGRLRRLLLVGLLVVLLYWARPTPWSLAAGFILVVVGESIRWWAAGYLLKTRELVTGGPYRYTRNPLYLGRLLIFTGLCIMVQLPWWGSWIALAGGWAIFFGYYLPRKERVEPARLRELHGEAFDHYFQAVPALFPRLTPYPEASESQHWSAARMRRNREYWMIIGLLLVGGFLLFRALSLGP